MKVYVLTIKAENVNMQDEIRIFDSREKVQDWFNHYVDLSKRVIKQYYGFDVMIPRVFSKSQIDKPFAYWEYKNQYDEEVYAKIEYETLEVE